MRALNIFAGAICVATGLTAPSLASASTNIDFDPILRKMETAPVATTNEGSFEVAKRGRGRGRGGERDRRNDDDRGDNRDRVRDRDREDGRSGGGRRPRIPGGSGCDDPGDVAEHAECRG